MRVRKQAVSKAFPQLNSKKERKTMKKILRTYDEPKIEILVLDVKDVITASSNSYDPFAGEEQAFI